MPGEFLQRRHHLCITEMGHVVAGMLQTGKVLGGRSGIQGGAGDGVVPKREMPHHRLPGHHQRNVGRVGPGKYVVSRTINEKGLSTAQYPRAMVRHNGILHRNILCFIGAAENFYMHAAVAQKSENHVLRNTGYFRWSRAATDFNTQSDRIAILFEYLERVADAAK